MKDDIINAPLNILHHPMGVFVSDAGAAIGPFSHVQRGGGQILPILYWKKNYRLAERIQT